MGRKSLIGIGVILAIFVLQSCQQHPEEGLLKRYFHAVTLKDVTTMSTMAVEPVSMEVENWEIVKVGEEKIEPFALAEMSAKEQEVKKEVDDHIGPTLDAKELVYLAEDELSRSRSSGAKRAAQKKLDEATAAYEKERQLHDELQKKHNEAKAAAAKEEEVASFSLGTELPNIKELTGNVHAKDVEVKIKAKGEETKTYLIHLKKYNLKDEALNMTHRGRWIIARFDLIS